KVQAHRSKPPLPLRSFRADVPPEMEAVIMRMLTKDPKDRQPSMAAVVAALAPWTREPIAPPPELEMPRWSPNVRSTSSPDPAAAAPPPPPAAPPPTPAVALPVVPPSGLRPVPARVREQARAVAPLPPTPVPARRSSLTLPDPTRTTPSPSAYRDPADK